MRKLFSKFAFTAALMLAITFTFSCSGGDDDDGSGNSSSSVNQCLSLPSWGKGASGTFVDDRDNTTYKWIEIGEQIWMAENLNHEADGTKCYNDDYGFSALPGGSGVTYFYHIGILGEWWSTSEYNSNSAEIRMIGNNDIESVGFGQFYKITSLSVRCVKDN